MFDFVAWGGDWMLLLNSHGSNRDSVRHIQAFMHKPTLPQSHRIIVHTSGYETSLENSAEIKNHILLIAYSFITSFFTSAHFSCVEFS